MTGTLRGVVVGHGAVAPALVAAAEEISGIRGVLFAVSNTGAGRDVLEERVVEAVEEELFDLRSAIRLRPGVSARQVGAKRIRHGLSV